MELGKWLIQAYAISIVVLLHINASLSLGHHHANLTRCVERERHALLAVKGDLVDNHNLLSSWGSGSEGQKQDCCRWERVYCDNQTGHVRRLDLGSDSLSHYFSPALEGTISPQLTQLHDLTYLNLSYNSFDESQIPAFIGSLTNLRYLDLRLAGFGGQIPSHALGNLTHLTYLDLSGNDFNGSQIPPFIGSLTNLTYLDLSFAGFGGQIPYQLGNLTHLQYLDLGFNYLFNSVENLNWLSHLSSLKYLDLSRTNLSNVFDWLETINKLPNLRNLTLMLCDLPPPFLSTLSHINSSKSLARVDLTGNNVTSSIFKWLCNYNTTLVHLDLSFTQLSGLIPDIFKSMSSLEYLYLYDNHLSGLIPDVFTNMNSLAYLGLSSNQLSGLIPGVLRNMSSLEILSLSHNQLSGLIPGVFRNMSSLEHLDLSRNQLSSLIPGAFKDMSSLEVLSLSHNQLSGLIPGVFKNMSSLEVLSLSHNQLSGLIPDVFKNISSLVHLDLSFNQLRGSTLDVFTTMSSLADLDLSNNPLEGGIPKSISQLCSLQSLRILSSSLDGLLSEFVQRLSSTCPQNSLHILDLSSNDLAGSFPNLTNFSSLKVLYLFDNQLSGMIPESIGQLSSLKELDLYGNRLSGIPESIGQLSSLERLELSGNRLSGRIPESIGNLSFLDEFYLSENNLSGMIPESIGQLSLLGRLDLSINRLSGRIPQSIGLLSNLYTLNLSMNSLNGVILETHFSNLSGLSELDLSSNLLLVFNVTSDWVPPFQLDSLNLRSCNVGPDFPQWLRTQRDLINGLDISYAGISDVLPSWFWGHFANIWSIDLSHNQIRGTIGSLEVVLFSGPEVRFSSNQFEGPIPSFLSNVTYLDLSNNKFSEMTSFLCAPGVRSLKFLNLASNNFSGELPNCWRHLANLQLLDLSHNAFSGKLPTALGSLFRITTLKLRSNRLVGQLSSSLQNCKSLEVIDLGYNNLSRSVPEWIGISLPNLVILMLQSNQFSGRLPSQLCHLAHLQILDLSTNEISGTIPKCLNNLTSLSQEGNSNLTIRHFFNASYRGNETYGNHYDDDATFMWKGRMSSYKNILGLVKRIDLSSNILTGEIPSEITHLVGLVSLNLSRNHFTGQITPKIGNLKSLDSLDLSRNQIEGGIPTSLAQINRLAYLDLSYNNLSSEIPTGTQLQGFDPSFYAGNPQLCGLPLKKICNPEETGQPNVLSNQEDHDELISEGFYISLGLGFAVGFWGVCGSLIFKRSWRYAYYKFLNASNDWLYVKVALIRRKLKGCA